MSGNPAPGRRALIVTGEASGDLHGANLIRAARERDPELAFFGVGGKRMAEAGCEILIPSEQLAVMGLVEVVGHLPVIWRAMRSLTRVLNGPEPPDVLVLIDFAEFNLQLAARAKKAGVPVLYYVSPQVWAWRRGRVKRIARVVDQLAAIFPFEPDLYRGQDIEVDYVGHPLLDEFEVGRDRATLLRSWGMNSGQPIIGLFPGSRRNEIKYIFDTLVQTALELQQQFPNARFLLPVAADSLRGEIEQRLAATELPVRLMEENIHDVIRACDAIMTVSGTVTLQIALSGTPMAIVYKMAPLSYTVGRRLIRVPHIGLANIVAGREVVREFVQEHATPANIATEMAAILRDDDYHRSIRRGLAEVREKMGKGGCSGRVAAMVSELSRRGVKDCETVQS